MQPSIPLENSVIDFKILSSCVTDKAGQIDILRSFHAENNSDITQLEQALAQGDADAATKTAHRMKGVCRMVGAHELQAICYHIETAARQADLETAKAAQKLLADAMHRIDATIMRFMHD